MCATAHPRPPAKVVRTTTSAIPNLRHDAATQGSAASFAPTQSTIAVALDCPRSRRLYSQLY